MDNLRHWRREKEIVPAFELKYITNPADVRIY